MTAGADDSGDLLVAGEFERRPLYRKLKPGPGRSADEVLANQCARLCGAMIQLAAERGYERVTVRGVSRLAGVSTKTFYKCFANVEECFAVTYAKVVRDTLRRASEVRADGADPLRARIRAVFEAFAQEPRAAQVLLVEFSSAGPEATEKARAATRNFERLLGEELAKRPRPVCLPSPVAQAIVGAALRVARTRLLDESGTDAADLAEAFAEWMLAVSDERLERLCRRVTSEQLENFTLERPRPPVGDEREYLLSAVAKLSAANGYRNLSVPAIRREAGVARSSFDANFANVTECFLAAVESRLSGLVDDAERGARGAASWERGLVRTVGCLCVELARDPDLARLGFVDILAPGRVGLELREGLVTRWTERLLDVVPADGRYGELAAEASIAAAWSLTKAEVAAGRHGRMARLAPAMAFVVLAPAVGPAAAERAISAELWPGSPSQKTSTAVFLTAR